MCTDASTGETIPIRLFLGGFDLTPTFREVNKKYSTRYYLSLVLIDEGTSAPLLLRRCVPYISIPLLHVSRSYKPLGPAHSYPIQIPRTDPIADARRYFKQSEIVLYRQAPEEARALAIDAPSIGGKLPTHTPPIAA